MAANIMVEVLKQIQQEITDQKEFMRNINEKLSNLTDKVDQQQVTLEKLDQHVIKNNKLLFGNDGTDINIKELSVMLYKLECNDNKQVNPVENYEASQQEKTSNTDDFIHSKDSDKVEEFITEEPVEMKNEHEVGSPVQEETAPITSPYFNIELINQFHVDLKRTMSEISEIKESIKDMNTRITPVDVTSGQMSIEQDVQVPPTCFNSEQINQLNGKLKISMSELIEIKQLLKDTATKINPVGETASPVNKQETVQLTLNYLSLDQISKLNDELKQITEKYQSTYIFPVVKLIRGPADDHWVMERLSEGISLEPIAPDKFTMTLKLGVNGFKRSVLQDLLTEYPDLNLYNVVEEVLSRNEWKELVSDYDVYTLHSM